MNSVQDYMKAWKNGYHQAFLTIESLLRDDMTIEQVKKMIENGIEQTNETLEK